MAAVFVSYNPCTVRAVYDYSKHVVVSFQPVDNVLDFDVDFEYGSGDNNNGRSGKRKKTEKGKFMDIRLGVVTAPVLYAA